MPSFQHILVITKKHQHIYIIPTNIPGQRGGFLHLHSQIVLFVTPSLAALYIFGCPSRSLSDFQLLVWVQIHHHLWKRYKIYNVKYDISILKLPTNHMYNNLECCSKYRRNTTWEHRFFFNSRDFQKECFKYHRNITQVCYITENTTLDSLSCSFTSVSFLTNCY